VMGGTARDGNSLFSKYRPSPWANDGRMQDNRRITSRTRRPLFADFMGRITIIDKHPFSQTPHRRQTE